MEVNKKNYWLDLSKDGIRLGVISKDPKYHLAIDTLSLVQLWQKKLPQWEKKTKNENQGFLLKTIKRTV